MSLLSQGLVVTAVGMGIVFLCLGLLWGVMSVLRRVIPARDAISAADDGPDAAETAGAAAQAEAAAELTAERAQVAAVVAAALMANVLPVLTDLPPRPTFEHGRIAPCWVTANRARSLQPWQPPRRDDTSPCV